MGVENMSVIGGKADEIVGKADIGECDVISAISRRARSPALAPCRRPCGILNSDYMEIMASTQTIKTSKARPTKQSKRDRSLSPEEAQAFRDLEKMRQHIQQAAK